MTDAPGAGSPPPGDEPPPADPPTSWEAPPPQPGPAPGIAFAPHGTRLIAYIIDVLIISIGFSAIAILLAILLFGGVGLSELRSGAQGQVSPRMAGAVVGFAFLMLFLALLSTAYFPYFWWRGGQTPGMKLFDLHVVRDADGGPLGGGQAVLRLFGLWIAGAVFYIGFIWVFIDARRRGWQDLIAGTCVIERPR